MSDLPEVRGELYGEAPGATRFQVGAFAGPRIHGQPAAWATLHTLGPFHLELPPGTWYLHAVGGAPDDGGFLSGSAMGSYGGIYGYGAPLPVGGAAPATVRIHLSPLWRDLTHVPHHRQPALSDEQWRAVHTVIDALGADLASRVDGDLGRAAGLVRTRLSALFRRATGLTMEEYRIRLRLEAAKALLVAGDGDLLALALEVGYETQAQLGRMFRRHLGISPGEFRRLSRALAAGAPAPGLNAAGPGAVLRHALRRLMRRGGTLRGTVSYAGSERGVVIYISAFPRPEPDSYPVAWVALPAPGPFTLRGVPAGRWYILAAYCRRRMLYPGDFHTAFAYGGYGAVDRGDGPADSQPVPGGAGAVRGVGLVRGPHAAQSIV